MPKHSFCVKAGMPDPAKVVPVAQSRKVSIGAPLITTEAMTAERIKACGPAPGARDD